MKNKKNVPAIRFKGFAEEWEVITIESIADKFYGGGTPRTTVERYWNGNIPWIQTSDLKEDVVFGVVPQKYISNSGVKESATKLVPENSISVITRVGVGKLALIPFKYATSQDFLSISKLKIDEYFAAYIIHRKMQTLLNEVQGTSIKGVTKEELLANKIEIPTKKDEQKSIGSYFKNIDRLINAIQSKLDKLKCIKKAYLEKMFPRDGSVTPRLRFKGFADEWKDAILEQIGNRYDNLRVPITERDRIAGKIPYYGANGIQDYVEGFTHDGEYILIAEDGANDLDNYPIQYVNGKIWVNNHAHVFQGFRDVADNLFLRYSISQTNIKSLLVGGGRTKLNAQAMMGIETHLPKNIKEQQKIGSFLRNIDDLIAKTEQQINKLKNIKKACLDKMFVNRED